MIKVQDASIPGSEFDDVNLENSTFTNVNLRNARFADVDLSSSRFEDINFANADIKNCTLDGMRINGHLVSDLLALMEKQAAEKSCPPPKMEV
jgi:uncharacterized protein YjbI with pentapeptide repeats